MWSIFLNLSRTLCGFLGYIDENCHQILLCLVHVSYCSQVELVAFELDTLGGHHCVLNLLVAQEFFN